MRVVDRPVQTVKRTPKMSYDVYGATLVRTFGAYCVACEAPLPSGVQVEHRVAKQANTNAAAAEFETFEIQYVVACGACNVRKSAKVKTTTGLGAYLWPDAVNTFSAFRFDGDGQTSAYQGLDAFKQDLFSQTKITLKVDSELEDALTTPGFADRADATIGLWGLNARTTTSAFSRELAADMRVASRKNAFAAAAAVEAGTPVIAGNDPSFPAPVAYAIISTGYWTIWTHCFLRKGRADLVQRMFTDPMLKVAFPNAASCVTFGDNVLTLTPHAEPQALEDFRNGKAYNTIGYVTSLGTEGSETRKYLGGPPARIGARGGSNKRDRDDDDDNSDTRERPLKRARHEPESASSYDEPSKFDDSSDESSDNMDLEDGSSDDSDSDDGDRQRITSSPAIRTTALKNGGKVTRHKAGTTRR